MKLSSSIPPHLQALLWSVDIKHLDLKKDKGYIIHQILRFGTLEDIQWLFDTYNKEEIKRVFLQNPSKNYAKVEFYFTKNYILGLKNRKIDEESYITSISGPIRPRATRGL